MLQRIWEPISSSWSLRATTSGGRSRHTKEVDMFNYLVWTVRMQVEGLQSWRRICGLERQQGLCLWISLSTIQMLTSSVWFKLYSSSQQQVHFVIWYSCQNWINFQRTKVLKNLACCWKFCPPKFCPILSEVLSAVMSYFRVDWSVCAKDIKLKILFAEILFYTIF